MTTTTKTMALAAAFIVPFFAAVSVQANNISDYNDGAEATANTVVAPYTTRVWSSANDYCNAVDSDGAGGAIPVGDDDSCDNNDTDTVSTINGPGEPTGLVGLFFPNCVDTPDNPTTMAQDAATNCDNGTFGIADDNGGDGSDGRFGGDYPNATVVVISVAVGQVAIVVQASYRDPWGANGTTANPTVFTGISTTVCIGNGVTYTVSVGGGGTQLATDPPAGQTIVGVFVGRDLDITCGGAVASLTSKTITMTWTYLTQVPDSVVEADITVTPDAGTPTCTITFANHAAVYNAGGSGRWGAVGSSVMIGPSNQYGNFQSVGPAYGAAGTWTGTVIVPAVHGQTVSWAVWAWSIEGNYTVNFGSTPCVNPPPTPNEPTCIVIVADPAVPPPTPVCLDPPGVTTTCTPAAAPGGGTIDCKALGACTTKVVTALAVGLGAGSAHIWCDIDLDGIEDTPGPPDEHVVIAFVPNPANAPATMVDLQQGVKTSGDYHCEFTWAAGFVGVLACFDP